MLSNSTTNSKWRNCFYRFKLYCLLVICVAQWRHFLGFEDGLQRSAEASVVQLHRERLLRGVRALLLRATPPPLRLRLGRQTCFARLGRRIRSLFGKYWRPNHLVRFAWVIAAPICHEYTSCRFGYIAPLSFNHSIVLYSNGFKLSCISLTILVSISSMWLICCAIVKSYLKVRC